MIHAKKTREYAQGAALTTPRNMADKVAFSDTGAISAT